MPVISKFTVGGHSVTKYNNQRLRQFVINGETCPFAKVAESLNGTLPDPISYRIHRLQASGNSSQATGSVPKYNCQGSSSVLNIGSFIKGDIYSVPVSADGITATFSQSNGTYAITGTSSAQGNVLLHNQITLENGHKYLVPTFRDATAAGASNYFQWGNVYARGIPAANFYWPDQSKAQSWAIVTGNGTSGYCIFNFMNGLDTSVSGFNPSGCFNLIDLTQLYGAGNEPANPETVFQDYPEIPVANDSWIKNDVIRSISSITLGGHTVSVDLRSAGSVYDEWASNSRGTRKCWVADNDHAYHTGAKSSSTYTNMFVIYGLGTSKATANNTIGNIVSNIFPADAFNNLYAGAVGCAISASGETWVSFGPDPNITTKEQADAWLAANNAQFQAELATPTSFSAGSPLTLASGLTPTDQDGNAVTFTETTEATPSPNYPVPIVNSSYISITDGQDTNSASIDLAGLTDKDEVYVNVKSTNIWDEEWEIGTIVSGEPSESSLTLRSKNFTAVEPNGEVTFTYPVLTPEYPSPIVFWYDDTKSYIGQSSGTYDVYTAPANAYWLKFVCVRYIQLYSTYNHDISISLGSSPVPYMPHNTNGKVWLKQALKLIDLGDLTYQKLSTTQNTYFFRAALTDKPKRPATSTGLAQLLCTAYKNTAGLYVYQAVANYTIAIPHDNDIVMLYDLDTQAMTEAQYKTYAAGIKLLYVLADPIWSDITSSAMGAALLALETIEESSNTITINNSGVIDMVQYFTPI